MYLNIHPPKKIDVPKTQYYTVLQVASETCACAKIQLTVFTRWAPTYQVQVELWGPIFTFPFGHLLELQPICN